MRDIFLEMICLTEDVTVSDFVKNQVVAEKLIEEPSQSLTKILNKCLQETKGSQFLTTAELPKESQKIIFTGDKPLIFENKFLA